MADESNIFSFRRLDLLPADYDSKDPWAKDLVKDRETLALTLTKKIRASQNPYVIGINSEWGTGKSLFLCMWHDWLLYCQNSNPIPCLYFNAWEYDYAGSPLEAFIACLQAQSKKDLPDGTAALPEKVTDTLKNLLRNAAPYIKIASKIAASVGSGLPAVGEAAEHLTGDVLALLTDKGDARKEFKQALKEFGQAAWEKTGCPAIIMVDELDRCRPSFAVELLENIKHLFYVSGIVFVLAVHRTQLRNSFKAVYGLDDSGAAEYLEKFIDLDVVLPPLDALEFCKTHLGTTYPLATDRSDTPDVRGMIAGFLAQLSKCSPRRLGQLMCRISILSAMDDMDWPILLVGVHKLIKMEESNTSDPKDIQLSDHSRATKSINGLIDFYYYMIGATSNYPGEEFSNHTSYDSRKHVYKHRAFTIDDHVKREIKNKIESNNSRYLPQNLEPYINNCLQFVEHIILRGDFVATSSVSARLQ
ncbi:MAG: KAP family NTPase [Desulfobulbus sp.]|nr:KAP family NTPase [Desulfobulbus sp.]